MAARDTQLNTAITAAITAGGVIRSHYERGEDTTVHKSDGSPVTDADIAANEVIVSALRAEFADHAILSEESTDDLARVQNSRVWIVDPLDGTRDFVRRTGEFSVHIGLAVDGVAELGVIYQPMFDKLFFATRGGGAFLRDENGERAIVVSQRRAMDELRVGVSRFALTPSLQALLDDAPFGDNLTRMGASTKMMAVACGELDVTLCLNDKENEWDTCAPEVILTEAGGRMTDVDGVPFRYNRRDVRRRRGIVVSNSGCHDQLAALARGYFNVPSV